MWPGQGRRWQPNPPAPVTPRTFHELIQELITADMGKTDREPYATHSRSPCSTSSTQLTGNIPEIFRSCSRVVPSSSQAPGTDKEVSCSPMRQSGSHSTEPPSPAAKSLSIEYLRAVAADIKNTLSAAISDLRLDKQAVAGRLEEVEEITERHEMAISKTHRSLYTHFMQLQGLHRNLEDLENRGRCHNQRTTWNSWFWPPHTGRHNHL